MPFLNSAYPASILWMECAAYITAHLRLQFIISVWEKAKSIWVFITILEKICIQIESKEALAFDWSHTTGGKLCKGSIVTAQYYDPQSSPYLICYYWRCQMEFRVPTCALPISPLCLECCVDIKLFKNSASGFGGI